VLRTENNNAGDAFMDNVRETLRPGNRNRIMDLVEATGIDVSDWANYRGRSPAANPKYCYEWIFRDERTTAICLWFRDILQEESGILQYRLNPRGYAENLRGYPGRASVVHRALTLDAGLRDASFRNLPLRVIVVEGTQVDLEKETKRSSRVDRRMLDPQPWHVAEYDDATGMTLLQRAPPMPRFVDQFDISSESGTETEVRQRMVNVRDRSASVRAAALTRAGGRCEYCGCEGFLRVDGSLYLETHHIIPLHEGGPDSVGNVVALCPNHHREAHHGMDRDVIRGFLLHSVQSASALEMPSDIRA
jgi:5-methylcytosine-specific restriction enzyme A